jgi:quercetin dioxygenase-like cupin family protein
VKAGGAIVRPAGSVGEIRNDTADPLEMVVVTMSPTGRVADLAAGPCTAAKPEGATTTVLNESVIDGPLSTESKGTTDIWVVLVRVAPGASTGWHVQQRPYFLGVNEGEFTLKVASDGGCAVNTYSPKQGFFEPPRKDHDVTNVTSQNGSFYGIGFVPNPEPPIAPAAAPKACA